MKNTKQNRLLGRHLARELTFDELNEIAGGADCGHTCTFAPKTGEHDEDHLQ